MLKDFEKEYGLIFTVKIQGADPNVNMHCNGQPLGAIFQAITDQTGYEFLVRDYGILVLDPNSHGLPANALPLNDFWKSHRAIVQPPVKPGSKPPSE